MLRAVWRESPRALYHHTWRLGARHSPETEPNEAIRRGANHKAQREQPRINIAATRDRAHEPLERREIVQASTDSSLNESSRDAFDRNERKEDEQNRVSVTNLARGVKMIRQGHPPGHLDHVVKKVFPFAGFCHVNFQMPAFRQRRRELQ